MLNARRPSTRGAFATLAAVLFLVAAATLVARSQAAHAVDIGGLQQRINAGQGKVSALSGVVGAYSGRLARLNSSIAQLQARLTRIQNDLNAKQMQLFKVQV